MQAAAAVLLIAAQGRAANRRRHMRKKPAQASSVTNLPSQADRRQVILGGPAALGRAVCPGSAKAQAGLGSAAQVLERVRAFQASLEPDKHKAASFAWDSPEWRGWNYFGASGYIKPGLRLEQMSK